MQQRLHGGDPFGRRNGRESVDQERGTRPRASIAGCAKLTRGPVPREPARPHITHDAGGTTPQGLSTAQLVALIRETGHEPVLRDTLYTELVAL
jgi:hypothetical protein